MYVNLVEYFNVYPPIESLIIGVSVVSANRRAFIDYDYAAESVSNHFEGLPPTGLRDFRRIVIMDISKFSARSSTESEASLIVHQLSSLISTSPICVQSCKISSSDGEYILDLNLDRGYGLHFEFAQAKAIQRICRAVRDESGLWGYRDVETDLAVDFFHPFDGISPQE